EKQHAAAEIRFRRVAGRLRTVIGTIRMPLGIPDITLFPRPGYLRFPEEQETEGGNRASVHVRRHSCSQELVIPRRSRVPLTPAAGPQTPAEPGASARWEPVSLPRAAARAVPRRLQGRRGSRRKE